MFTVDKGGNKRPHFEWAKLRRKAFKSKGIMISCRRSIVWIERTGLNHKFDLLRTQIKTTVLQLSDQHDSIILAPGDFYICFMEVFFILGLAQIYAFGAPKQSFALNRQT